MKEQIIKKAWTISALALEEPWHYNNITVTATTRGEARSKGLQEMHNLGASKLVDYKYDDRDLKYTDITPKRCKASDIILFEDKEIKRYQLEAYLWMKERDEKALQLTITNPGELAVVYSGCYGSYWGYHRSGYSDSIIFAGKYTTEEAYSIVRGSAHERKETVELLDVEQFNETIDKEICSKQKEIDRLNSYTI
jgi:hypothetical protein